MSIVPATSSLLSAIFLSGCLAKGAAAAAPPDTLTWEIGTTVGWLNVVGQHLSVRIMDPQGRSDSGAREHGQSAIPRLTGTSGPSRTSFGNPPIDQNMLVFDPQPETYLLEVTSPIRQRVAVIAHQPFLDDDSGCKDRLIMNAGSTATWAISWSLPDTGTRIPCGMRLTRVGGARGPGLGDHAIITIQGSPTELSVMDPRRRIVGVRDGLPAGSSIPEATLLILGGPAARGEISPSIQVALGKPQSGWWYVLVTAHGQPPSVLSFARNRSSTEGCDLDDVLVAGAGETRAWKAQWSRDEDSRCWIKVEPIGDSATARFLDEARRR